jgi:hypothetical protein
MENSDLERANLKVLIRLREHKVSRLRDIIAQPETSSDVRRQALRDVEDLLNEIESNKRDLLFLENQR